MTKIKLTSHAPGVMNDYIRQMVLQNNRGEISLSKPEFVNCLIAYSLPLQYTCFPEFEFVGNNVEIKEYKKHTITLSWIGALNDKEADIANLETQEHLS